jgi:hypothetical protein
MAARGFVEPLEDGDRERGGLAGARARLAEHVDALEGEGNDAGLNGGGLLVGDAGERRKHRVREAQFGEEGQLRRVGAVEVAGRG